MECADNDKRLTDYRVAVAVVKNMERAGKLSADSARLLYAKLSEKYGVKKGSIFAL